MHSNDASVCGGGGEGGGRGTAIHDWDGAALAQCLSASEPLS
jgi:hypothetical protein